MKGPSSFSRLLAHPLVGYLALLLLIAAVLQGAGRLGMWMLDDFEGALNAYLGKQAQVRGLEGGWAGLNPVVRIRRVDATAGWAEQVLLELDWMETLMRSRLIMRRLFVERGALNVAYVDGRWTLAGAGPQVLDLNWRDLLNHTDEIRFRGQLAVADATSSELDVEVLGVNRDGLHGFDLSLAEPGCGEGCTLTLKWRSQPNRWSLLPAERRIQASGQATLPGAYLPWLRLASSTRLGAVGDWTQRGTSGGGEFALHISQGDDTQGTAMEFRVRVKASSQEGLHRALIDDVQLQAGDSTLSLNPMVARTDGREATLWLDALPLEALSELLIQAFGEGGTAASWLTGTRPRGQLRNLHFGVSGAGIAYAATLDGVQLAAHRGLPMLNAADGSLIGYERGLSLALNSEAVDAQFADSFANPWRLRNLQGNIDCWFRDGYLGLRSTYFRTDLAEGPVAGSLALARTPDRFGQRLALLLTAGRLRVPEAGIYVPFTIPAKLKEWLDEAPRDGTLADFRLAYQGQVHTQPDDYSRRAAIAAQLRGGEVLFHRDWPLIAAADGRIEVSGEDVFVQVASASSLGVGIQASDVHVGQNGAFAEVKLQAEAPAAEALAYIRASPLADWLDFIEPDWRGGGDLGVVGDLFVPLNEQTTAGEAERSVAADLTFALTGLSLDMPGYRLAVAGLNGKADYAYPYALNSAPIAATLFGQSATVTASADEGAIDFQIVGKATPADVYHLADMDDYGLAAGTFPFAARLSLPVDGQAPSLTTTTALEGLEILLPGQFGKTADRPRPTQVDLAFLDEHTALSFNHGDVQGWVHVQDAPLRGALGVRRQPPDGAAEGDEILIAGQVSEVDVYEWTQGAGDWEFPAPWRLQDVVVERVSIETLGFPQVQLQGNYRDGVMELAFASASLQGRLRDAGDDPLALHFDSIVLADDGEDEEDPLDAAVIDRLPPADVSIDSILVGEEDFGRWSFAMRPKEDGVLLDDLEAVLKGTAISAPAGVFWHRDTDRSAAVAELSMQDLEEVLPQWGFTPSLHSESAELKVEGDWPGSPLNASLENLVGNVVFEAKNGRFVEVESGAGALRLFSLLNFNTIAKRMSLNFKDVVGKGVSFDTVEAKAHLDSGTLTFLEPAKVKGSGSDFKIGGNIDIVAGVMNHNELIVTLPVTDSLPWYAVYVSLANPAAGLAVLAGQQVLKRQIKQFSSAKYEVNGPWDDPEVKLVGIWDDDMQTFNEIPNEQAQAQEGGR